MIKTKQGGDYTVEYRINGKDKRLVLLLNNCCTEGLLDWKPLNGHNDCKWCPYKVECDRAWDDCSLCSYMEARTKLKAMFKLKHHWAKTHSTCDLVAQKV